MIPVFSYFIKKYPFLRVKTNEIILGNVLTAGIGMNPARMAAVQGGVVNKVPAYTINHVCASGMSAIIQGDRAIRLGDADLILAGGMESMSQAPVDCLQHDGLFCSLSEMQMGETAEYLNQKYHISRKRQDRYA